MVAERRAGVSPILYLLLILLGLAPGCAQKPEHNFDGAERLIAAYQPPTEERDFVPIPEALLDFQLPEKKAYRLGEGDVVLIKVLHTTPVPGFEEGVQAEVKEDGKIRLPIVGRFDALDKTVLELEEALTKPIQEDFVKGAVVSIRVTGFGSRKYFVVGEVAKPGKLAANGKTTLLEALLEVGGTNADTADLDEAYIVRDQEPIPFSIRDIVMRGHPAGRLVMEEHDIVFIPHVKDRDDFVYIFGEVGSPSRVPMEHERRRGMVGTLTLDAALAQAGGLNPRADINSVIVYRGTWNAPKRYKIGIQDVYQFGNEIHLMPGDRIAVGTSSAASFSDAMAPYFQLLTVTSSTLSLAISAMALSRTN